MKRVRTIVMKIPYFFKVKVIFAININCCTNPNAFSGINEC